MIHLLIVLLTRNYSFTDSRFQDSVPAALTKDKKRVLEQEISVHLAWKSTLYVTNFPEKSDDASIRELFGKVGGCPFWYVSERLIFLLCIVRNSLRRPLAQ